MCNLKNKINNNNNNKQKQAHRYREQADGCQIKEKVGGLGEKCEEIKNHILVANNIAITMHSARGVLALSGRSL